MPRDDTGRLDELERRIAALEVMATAGGPAPASPAYDLRQLDDLRRREGPRYERGSMRGAIAYAGSAKLGEEEVLWAGEHGLPEIWDLEQTSVARLLAALAHPARLALVRALLTGDRTSHELQAVIDSGSAGQLYHHLRDLISAGIVDQTGRSRYRIADSRVIPLLVILAAASDVARPAEHDFQPAARDDKEGER
jgi:DNA-binding transcriptional ArsR family regulator